MKRIFKQIPLIAIAASMIATSVNMFFAPHKISGGGVSGVGVLVETAFGINRAIVVLSINIVLLILAGIFLKRSIVVKTIIGSVLVPVALAIVPQIKVVDNIVISIIFGSIILGCGVALLYKIEASSGGTTIPPLIFKKYFGLEQSIGLFICDALIVFFNIFVFGFNAFFYSIFALIVSSIVINYITSGLSRRKAVMIMSEKNIDEIRNILFQNVNRGMTVFDVSGGYTGAKKEMLMIILGNQEYHNAMKLINSIDKNAFVISYNVAEVHGRGFTYRTME